MTRKVTAKQLLDTPMQPNDAGAETIREYFTFLLERVWLEGEGFSGKRPFGNSGWEDEVYLALGKANIIDVELDEDGYLEDVKNETEASRLVQWAILGILGSRSEPEPHCEGCNGPCRDESVQDD